MNQKPFRFIHPFAIGTYRFAMDDVIICRVDDPELLFFSKITQIFNPQEIYNRHRRFAQLAYHLCYAGLFSYNSC